MPSVYWKVIASVAAALCAFFALRIFGTIFTTTLGDVIGATIAAVLVWKFVAVWELKQALETARSTVKKIGV